MKLVMYPLLIVLSLFYGIAIAADSSTGESKEMHVNEISVMEVKHFVDTKAKNVVILDANNSEARKDAGVVPGAILLTSYNQYSLSELPKDKNTTLVFYCYNSYCQASHVAAGHAIGAGYKDVRVMKEGIEGWNEVFAKNKTQRFKLRETTIDTGMNRYLLPNNFYCDIDKA